MTERHTRLHSTTRTSTVDPPLDQVWAVVAGGAIGPQWYVDAWPFVFRGGLDRLFGGEGRRWPPPGRRLLRVGDTVGFWRVVECAQHRLTLRAEVRAPGRVDLLTTVRTAADQRTAVTQTVRFEPDGLLGQAYLLADLPAREVVMELAHRRLLADVGAVS